MSAAVPFSSRPNSKFLNADRIGVFASVLCAFHCALTPFLLLFLPTFGKIWSHPASHWGMALVVVPIAGFMMSSGYRRHRRRWIVAVGSLGIIFVIAGAIVPYVVTAPQPAPVVEEEPFVWNVGEELPETTDDEVFVHVAGEDLSEAACADSCCPSLVTDADGNIRLHVPLASIVTTLGGIALIVTHLGNLCCCRSCRRSERISPF